MPYCNIPLQHHTGWFPTEHSVMLWQRLTACDDVIGQVIASPPAKQRLSQCRAMLDRNMQRRHCTSRCAAEWHKGFGAPLMACNNVVAQTDSPPPSCGAMPQMLFLHCGANAALQQHRLVSR